MTESQSNQNLVPKSAIKFAVTGVGSTLIHVVVATILISLLNSSTQFGNGVAFVIATIFSYTVNTLWSFSNTLSRRTALRFIITSFGGLILTILISTAAEMLGLDYRAGIGLVVISVPVYSYLAHSLWTYR